MNEYYAKKKEKEEMEKEKALLASLFKTVPAKKVDF